MTVKDRFIEDPLSAIGFTLSTCCVTFYFWAILFPHSTSNIERVGNFAAGLFFIGLLIAYYEKSRR